MDSAEVLVAIVLLVLSVRFAIRSERMYQALKSYGAYKGRVALVQQVVEFSRGYEEAREDFIREQKDNRQSVE